MNVGKLVQKAWSRTIRDFKEAKENGDACIWTEDTLRLNFFRRLCEQDVKVKRILSEVEFNLAAQGKRRPDLVLSIESKYGIVDVAFEFKYFGRDWQKSWEDLKRYAVIGWRYGYFLAIGRLLDCDKIPKRTEKLRVPGFLGATTYEVKAMTHVTSGLEIWPDFKVAEDLAKKTLKGIPYVANEFFGAVAFDMEKGYAIYFDMINARQDKCIVYVALFKEAKELRGEHKLREIGYDKFVSFDKEGYITPSKKLGFILLGEFEPTSYPENVNKVKAALDRFRKEIDRLRR